MDVMILIGTQRMFENLRPDTFAILFDLHGTERCRRVTVFAYLMPCHVVDLFGFSESFDRGQPQIFVCARYSAIIYNGVCLIWKISRI